MNQGVIERLEYRPGGGLYGDRAYVRIWVTDKNGRGLCWIDVEATNHVLKKCHRVWWRAGRAYFDQWSSKPMVLEQLGYGEPEGL